MFGNGKHKMQGRDVRRIVRRDSRVSQDKASTTLPPETLSLMHSLQRAGKDSKRFPDIGLQIGTLVEEKQAAYGDSFGKAGNILRELYPDGIPTEKLDDALTITRVVDKLFRIATKKDAFGESPWRDIAGYSLLAIRRDEIQKKTMEF